MLTYIGNVTINGFPGLGKKSKPDYDMPKIPEISLAKQPQDGTKQILTNHGPDGLVQWIKNEKKVLLTDTTFRDAHQSLLATRVRTNDLVHIAEPTAKLLPDLFSLEMWGGATFDVAYRFLNEDPWQRLLKLEKAYTKCFVPNAA